MSQRLKAHSYLLITALIWGIASPVIKYTLRYIPPFAFLFWRFLITALVFLPILLVYKKIKNIKLGIKKILKLSALGFLGTTLSLSLLFIGYKYTTAIDGALLFSVAPIMVVIGGAVFLNEIVTKMEKFGSFLALLGSIITVIQPILEGKALALQNLKGNILVFFSAITWAAYCLIVRKFEHKEKINPVILTSTGFIAGFITIIPFFLFEYITTNDYLTSTFQPPNLITYVNPAAWAGILYMAFFSSVIAFLTYNLGYSLIEASEATLFDYLKPIFAAPIAVIWLGEQITLPFLAGAGLIALGVFLTEWKPRSKIKAYEKRHSSEMV